MSKRLVQTVLHPTDFSETSNLAFAQALAVSLLGDTTLTILHVSPDADTGVDWSSFPPIRRTLERWGLLEPGMPRSAVEDEFNIRVKRLVVRGATPAQAILDHLQSDPADLVVVATEGRKGLASVTQPSRAQAIARKSRCTTLFVSPRIRRGAVSPQDGSGSLTRILVPVDTEPDCAAALTFAQHTAKHLGDAPVSIILLHIGGAMPVLPTLEQGPEWIWQTELRAGDPVQQILAAATRHRADLIVMATAGSSGVLDTLRGSTTEQVVRDADCPVLVVPTG